RAAGDSEALGRYPAEAYCGGVALGGGSDDLGGLQQMQAPFLGAARPPWLSTREFLDLEVGVRLAARSWGHGVSRPAASRNLLGELRIRDPRGRLLWRAAQLHVLHVLDVGEGAPPRCCRVGIVDTEPGTGDTESGVGHQQRSVPVLAQLP
ncbi:MAG: hypothetical protein ACRDS0_36970, partial [Pseudonocardiaceae bacterium]